VRYVVKGNTRKSGDRIRVVSELLEVSTDRYIWADQLDRDLRHHGDIFAIEDEIVEQIVTALDVKLLSGEAGRYVRNALRNPAARESLYRAEDLLWSATSKLELKEAQRLAEDVIRLEPTSPVGYAEAALAYWAEVETGLSDKPSQAMDRAVKWAREAIERDDPTGYGRMIMCHVHLRHRNHDEALIEADLAVAARPSCPTAYSYKAAALNYLGRPDEAIELAKFARRLTPVHPPDFPAILSAAYYGLKRHDEAISAARAAIEADPQDVEPRLILAASNMALGRTKEAQAAIQEVLKIVPTFDLTTFADSQPYKDQRRLDGLLGHLKNAGLE
jgi:tetratricopeptide (TPR) repeat protein